MKSKLHPTDAQSDKLFAHGNTHTLVYPMNLKSTGRNDKLEQEPRKANSSLCELPNVHNGSNSNLLATKN